MHRIILLSSITVFSFIACMESHPEQNLTQKVTRELAQMAQEDQSLRWQVLQRKQKGEDLAVLKKELLTPLAKIHTEKLKEIIAVYGWPTISKFGAKAAYNAWLIAQHADHDINFQQYCLHLMSLASESNDVSHENLAYLYDRVKTNNNEPQFYATQVTANNILLPIEGCQEALTNTDIKTINARRAAMKMNRIQDYLREISQAMNPTS